MPFPYLKLECVYTRKNIQNPYNGLWGSLWPDTYISGHLSANTLFLAHCITVTLTFFQFSQCANLSPISKNSPMLFTLSGGFLFPSFPSPFRSQLEHQFISELQIKLSPLANIKTHSTQKWALFHKTFYDKYIFICGHFTRIFLVGQRPFLLCSPLQYL